MRLRRPLAASALLLLGIAAVPALAADHEATLGNGATRFEWEGAAQVARGAPVYVEEARTTIPCDSGPARPCEEILFRLAEDGKLTVKVEGLEGTGGTTDVDLYLYASDASGAMGEKIGSSAANGPDTVSAAKAKAGYYLAVADYYHAYNSGYAGVATFVPAVAPVAPPPVAAPTPSPPPTPAGGSSQSKRKPAKAAACKKKARKIKNKKKRKKALRKCSRKHKRGR